MRARTLRLHPKTKQKLIRLKKEAEIEGAYRVAKRIHAVLMNHDEYTSGQIALLLGASRSKVSEWLKNYEAHGYGALLEGHRTGRKPALIEKQREELEDIVDSGPVAYGFTSGVWTSPMIRQVVEMEFGISYHPGHVRKLLHDLGFSVQRPKRKLARADPKKQDRWKRYDYPNLKKKPRRKERH